MRDDNGEEVEFSDIAKAYESEDGEMVIPTQGDLASLPVEQFHEIEVTEFVPADQVDPMAFSEDDDDEENLPPPAVGYPGGGNGFNVGGVDVGSKALDFEAPPIECEDGRGGAAGGESGGGSPRRPARLGHKVAARRPFSARCRV